jgi:hypothetical protein
MNKQRAASIPQESRRRGPHRTYESTSYELRHKIGLLFLDAHAPAMTVRLGVMPTACCLARCGFTGYRGRVQASPQVVLALGTSRLRS